MTESQRGTATGAGIGAVTGAAIGALAGGGKGAAIGAGVGAAAGAGGGYLWSQHMQEQKQAMEAATEGTGVAVKSQVTFRLIRARRISSPRCGRCSTSLPKRYKRIR
jgi:uncharacterized protein YcfJ